MKLKLIRMPSGFALHEDSMDAAASIKIGTEVSAEVRVPRNYKFFKKWWALVTVLYDIWCETDRTLQYNGVPVQPSLERFRKDVTILAGYYEPVYAIDGSVKLQAKSISFAGMEEDEFAKLYSATINVGLQKIIPKGRYTEAELRDHVEAIVGFC